MVEIGGITEEKSSIPTYDLFFQTRDCGPLNHGEGVTYLLTLAPEVMFYDSEMFGI